MTIPTALKTAYTQWSGHGRPTQIASQWNTDAWVGRLSDHEAFLRGLDTNRLNRDQVVDVAPDIENEETAVHVFLLAMLWGYGTVGYGPYRTHRILSRPEAKTALYEVAQAAQQYGGLSAFELIADRRKRSGSFLKYLGPAFGTKYIYFVTAQADRKESTPVMDAVVQRWFREHVEDCPLTVVWWHTESYRKYLRCLDTWAGELEKEFGDPIRRDEVEYLIFASGSGFERNSWVESWEAGIPASPIDQLRDRVSGLPVAEEAEALIDKLEKLLKSSDEGDSPTS